MSLLLLFNQPVATPTPPSGGMSLSRQPKPRIPYMRDNRIQDDELVMMLLMEYLKREESDYAD